jgi:hypothetical protein
MAGMVTRSLDRLDLDLAWQRVTAGERRGSDVSDRFSIEAINRLLPSGPILEPDHHVSAVVRVMGTKGSQTGRPFARLHSADRLLYQALVDRLSADIEARLSPRDVVFSHRVSLDGADMFAASPNHDDFLRAVEAELSNPWRSSHALTGDITSYFVYIDIASLEQRLLSVCEDADAVLDLGALLRGFELSGVRGLPQGIPASSPLGNLYLAGLDDLLIDSGLRHLRYMDDFWVFTDGYDAAREAQDLVERYLYDDRLALGGAKSLVRQARSALRSLQRPRERREERRARIRLDLQGSAGDEYATLDDSEIDEADIDTAAAYEEFDELADELEAGRYPEDVRTRLFDIFRSFEQAKDDYGAARVPAILRRRPDTTWPALRYIARLPAESRPTVDAALAEILAEERFHRELEWLHMCRAALLLRGDGSPELAQTFARLSREHPHPLVRARALLGWGRLADPDDFDAADDFWLATSDPWRPYAVAAIQEKVTDGRDARYEAWASAYYFLRELATSLKEKPLSWRTM